MIGGLAAGDLHRVRVRAVNAEGESGWVEVAGTPMADLAPVFSSASFALSVSEGAGVGVSFGTVAASDPGDVVVYALSGADAALFAVDGSGRLFVAGALDYESKESYAFTVTAADAGGQTASAAVTVTVGDADEPPGAPTGVEVAAGAESLSVSWAAPAAAAGVPAVAGYEVQHARRTAAGPPEEWGDWVTVSQGPGPSVGAYTAVSAGWFHSCAVRHGMGVVCWGSDTYGEATPPSGSFTAVSAGWFHSCGIRDGGAVACWGHNGDGEAAPPSGSFTAVSAGLFHSCGIRDGGAVACWGRDSYGRAAPPSGSFTAVSTGHSHSCGTRDGGAVACWGYNGQGQAAPPSGSFTAISAGVAHSCGIKDGGAVACWGDDSYGRAAPPSGSFTAISAGVAHSCGIRDGGAVACWGRDSYGRAAPPSGSFTAISAGVAHSCAIRKGGVDIVCWGGGQTMVHSAALLLAPTVGEVVIGGLAAGDLYRVRVRAANHEGSSGWVEVAGTPADLAPVFSASSFALSVNEDAGVGVSFGTVVASDPGDVVVYALSGADAALFAVDGSGRLFVAGALDYESKDSYAFTVTAAAGGQTASAAVTVTVDDVDEPPGAPPGVAVVAGRGVAVGVVGSARGGNGGSGGRRL